VWFNQGGFFPNMLLKFGTCIVTKVKVGDLYVFPNVKEKKPKIQKDYTNIDFTISINYIEVILAPGRRF